MEGNDLGVVELDGTLSATVVITDADRAPADPSVAPTFRAYGEAAAPMSGGSGSATKLDTGSVTGATNASPIVVTSVAHGLTTGTRVTLSSVGGNTAANGTFTVTRIGADTFSLDGSTGNGAYTAGGAWHVTGLYRVSLSVASGSGYEAGKTYYLLVSWTVSAVAYSMLCPFRVV